MTCQVHKQDLIKPSEKAFPVNAVAVTPDGNHALSSGLDFTMRQWDLRTRKLTQSWEAGGPLSAITIHSSGEWALISTVMGALLWDLSRWQFIRSYRTNYGGTYDIAYSESMGMVIGAGEDSLIYRWDFESGEKYKPLVDHQYPVSTLAVSDRTNLILSGDSSGEIRLWELSSGDPLAAWQGHDNLITDLAVLPQYRKLVSASHEPQIKIWDLDSGEKLNELSDHTGRVTALAASKDENWMLSAGEDGIRIWDLENYRCLYSDPSDQISCLALRADDKVAISGSRDGGLSIWSLQFSDQEL